MGPLEVKRLFRYYGADSPEDFMIEGGEDEGV
jgi:hypothetical protein